MALAFSLVAALLAILVQKWVRDYMHVFNRYSDSLKSGRLRQYLYEGCWYMPIVAEFVPGCLHVSLFLFFAGLGNSLFKINTKVAISTIVPIAICGVLYIMTIFLPIISPRSPYENSFSGIIWFLFQKLHVRKYKDWGPDGESKPVDKNMAQGRMQLAMEETEARKDRDARAIRWLIENLTEDAEMDKLLSRIPGSFNTDWGVEVWNKVGEREQGESDANAQGDVGLELSKRINRSFVTCKNRGLFDREESWRKRTRACVESTALLVYHANAKFAWFGDIVEPLGNIGTSERTRESSLAGRDQLFVMRWTCLSLVAIRQNLENNGEARDWAKQVVDWFAKKDDTGNDKAPAGTQKVDKKGKSRAGAQEVDEDGDALAGARKIDGNLRDARESLFQLYHALRKENDLTTNMKLFKKLHVYDITKLERFSGEADKIRDVDFRICDTQSSIAKHSHQITPQIPGVLDDLDDLDQAPVPFSRVVELYCKPHKRQFIRPGRTLKSMCSPYLTFQKDEDTRGDADRYKELLRSLEKFCSLSAWEGNEMQRQVWRLRDLGDGGGFGFTVELFFIALEQLLSTSSSSKESHSALYMATFKAITSDRGEDKRSLGTLNFLLHIAWSRRREFKGSYPTCIVDEFFSLLGDIFEGQDNTVIDEARQQVGSLDWAEFEDYRDRALNAITRAEAQSS